MSQETDFIFTGHSDGSVRKYDSSGNLIWSSTLHTGDVFAIAVDDNGFIYSGGRNDFTVRKIDSNGNQVWAFTNHTNQVRDIAVDNNGNVYSVSFDKTVRKIDSNGNQVWSFTEFTGFVTSVKLDINGNVYAGATDFTVRKIDSNGNQVWVNNIGTSILSMAVDSQSNVYASGNFVRKFDANGTEDWTFSIGNTIDSTFVDFNLNVYVGLRNDVNGVKKISLSGNLIWEFDNPNTYQNDIASPNDKEFINALSVDYAGFVYIADNGGSLIKLDENGNQIFNITTSPETDRILSIAVNETLPMDQPPKSPIKLGETDIFDIYKGNTLVDRAYKGETLFFGKSHIFEIGNISYNNINLDVNAQDFAPRDLTFNDDGSKMYFIGSHNDSIYQFTLSENFNISTATYDNVNFSVSNEETTPLDLIIKNNGQKLYITGQSSDTVYQYTFGTPYDLSTVIYNNVSFSVSNEETSPYGIEFNSDGSKMFVVGVSGNVNQYNLATNFDISTASYSNLFLDHTNNDIYMTGISFNQNFTKMFLIGFNSGTIYQYTINNINDISNAIYDNVFFDLNDVLSFTNIFGLKFSDDGKKIYSCYSDDGIIYQFDNIF